MTLLFGKTAIVTGASRGIGRAIALAFIGQGARVVLNASRGSPALSETEEIIHGMGGECAIVSGLVQDAMTARQMVATAVNRFGGLDILVNNAGITRDKPLLLMSENEFDDVYAVNMRGVYQCSREAIREMMKKRSGRIISISSISAISGRPGQCNYAASKAGVVGFTKSLAREVGKQNILVNALLVGVIDTEMTKQMPPATKLELQRVSPLGRMGRAEEVANSCVFLASELSTFVTGTTLNVSGGGYV